MSINSAPVQDGIIVQANLKIKNDVYSFDFDFNEKKPNLTVKLTMPSRNGKSKTYEFGINKKDDGLGMISHKKSLITIFGHKHKIKNFIKKFYDFHKKISCPLDFRLYLE